MGVERVISISGGGDLSLEKTDDIDPVIIGDTLTYTITVTNNGPDTAEDVTVTDTIPSEILNPEYSLDGGDTWITPWTGALDLGNMTPESSTTILIRGTVDPLIPEGRIISNVANVTSSTYDIAKINNKSCTHTEVAKLLITGTVVRVGYFEFFIRIDTNMWKIRIPDRGYDAGWMPFNRLRGTNNYMSGYYGDRRYKLIFDWYSSGRCHIIFNDRRERISIKFAGR